MSRWLWYEAGYDSIVDISTLTPGDSAKHKNGQKAAFDVIDNTAEIHFVCANSKAARLWSARLWFFVGAADGTCEGILSSEQIAVLNGKFFHLWTILPDHWKST